VRCISVSDLVSIGRNDALCDMAFPFDVVCALLCVARIPSFTEFSRVYDNLCVQRSPLCFPFKAAKIIQVANIRKLLDDMEIELLTITRANVQVRVHRKVVELDNRYITLSMNRECLYMTCH